MHKMVELETTEGPVVIGFQLYGADRIVLYASHCSLQEALNVSAGGDVQFAALPASELIALGKELEKEYGEVSDEHI